jgi:hypothetical protein
MEPEDSLPCPQEHATGPYPKPDKYSPHRHPICLRPILILSKSTRRFSDLCLSFRPKFYRISASFFLITYCIVTHMAPASRDSLNTFPRLRCQQQKDAWKHRIVKSEYTSITRQRFARARLPWNYTRFRHNAYTKNSSGAIEGRDFYPVLPKL